MPTHVLINTSLSVSIFMVNIDLLWNIYTVLSYFCSWRQKKCYVKLLSFAKTPKFAVCNYEGVQKVNSLQTNAKKSCKISIFVWIFFQICHFKNTKSIFVIYSLLWVLIIQKMALKYPLSFLYSVIQVLNYCKLDDKLKRLAANLKVIFNMLQSNHLKWGAQNSTWLLK